MVLIDARFMVVARRSVCGAPLKAATIGLWPVDDFHRIAQGHHRDCSCRHSRSLHDHIGLALAKSQVAAIRLALMSKVLVMTGGPGVGKTTIVKAACSSMFNDRAPTPPRFIGPG
jgi:AAA domain